MYADRFSEVPILELSCLYGITVFTNVSFMCRILLTISCSLEKGSYIEIFSSRSTARNLPPIAMNLQSYNHVLSAVVLFSSSSHIRKMNGRIFIFSAAEVFSSYSSPCRK
jgi:hypothetical protein